MPTCKIAAWRRLVGLDLACRAGEDGNPKAMHVVCIGNSAELSRDNKQIRGPKLKLVQLKFGYPLCDFEQATQ